MAAFVPLQILANLVVMATLFGFVLVSAAVLVLRRIQATERATFRTPFGPLVPLVSIGSCLLLMLALPGETWVHLALWLLLGVGVYLARMRAVSRQESQKL